MDEMCTLSFITCINKIDDVFFIPALQCMHEDWGLVLMISVGHRVQLETACPELQSLAVCGPTLAPEPHPHQHIYSLQPNENTQAFSSFLLLSFCFNYELWNEYLCSLLMFLMFRSLVRPAAHLLRSHDLVLLPEPLLEHVHVVSYQEQVHSLGYTREDATLRRRHGCLPVHLL